MKVLYKQFSQSTHHYLNARVVFSFIKLSLRKNNSYLRMYFILFFT